ncbi:2-oxoglutarate dehydrogenase E2 component [Thioalkalivibrio sp. ALE21]|uniref:2-oxoglutarate dehydrogenase complex dihydrolipoyllysine-residue succinyltransferase n=1 Tax=Thioalkalivibrio sp. ALE21 TaxID=1158175 RepID=UPI000D921AED|nr:2-oxoglutarate dehydrogenase complex dihydrolipoyllysine-residue succinyltransferase [Thioalkalivibrio sp. ALE21]PYG03627.1 2-oxoglutarate dehydrogenase E2 component [Thioalkalivibrio sp. ALE21]
MSAEQTPIQVPQLPESVADATVVALHRKPGDAVRRDELIAELETDKVVLEVNAPADGTLVDLAVAEGDTVHADDVLGHLGPAPAQAAEEAPAAGEHVEPEPDPASAEADEADAGDEGPEPEPVADAGSPPPPSPAVRRLLQEAGLSEDQVRGTGPDGRIQREDVERAQLAAGSGVGGKGDDTSRRPAADDAGRDSARAAAGAEPPAGGPRAAGERGTERVPMSRLRARIAERLLEAKQSTAMLTTFNEIDMSQAMALRGRYKDRFEQTHGIKLGFMGLFVVAATRALQRFPVINAALDGEEIVYHHYTDIGIAVSSPRGLVVPVLRDTGNASIADIERRIRDFAERAGNGKLDIDELRGGTFTITNGGVFGSLFSTPIVNPPQSAILGMHAIKERPVAVDGEVVIRPMMYVALSYDHRLVDGADAVQFLVAIKEAIEDPARLVLDV